MQARNIVLTGFLTIGKPYAAACRATFHLSAKQFGAVKKTALDFPLKQTSPASILGGMRDLGRVAEIQVKRSALPPYLLFWRDDYNGCAAPNR